MLLERNAREVRRTEEMLLSKKLTVIAGASLILLIGLIHLVDASDSMEESSIKGLLFYANSAGAVVAAIGIWRRATWGWVLGLLIAAGAFVGYIISRTVGIFGLPPDVWLEPLGVAAMLTEALLIGLSAKVLLASAKPA